MPTIFYDMHAACILKIQNPQVVNPELTHFGAWKERNIMCIFKMQEEREGQSSHNFKIGTSMMVVFEENLGLIGNTS